MTKLAYTRSTRLESQKIQSQIIQNPNKIQPATCIYTPNPMSSPDAPRWEQAPQARHDRQDPEHHRLEDGDTFSISKGASDEWIKR